MDTPLPHPHFPKIRALLTGNVDSWIHCRGTITVIVTTFRMIFSLPDIALLYLSSHLTTILLSSIGWGGLEETCFVSSRVSRVGGGTPLHSHGSSTLITPHRSSGFTSQSPATTQLLEGRDWVWFVSDSLAPRTVHSAHTTLNSCSLSDIHLLVFSFRVSSLDSQQRPIYSFVFGNDLSLEIWN